MKIGHRIRKVRKQMGMTLQELSRKARVDLATLSRLENQRMTGTLESHVKIARALRLGLGDLYQEFAGQRVPSCSKGPVYRLHHECVPLAPGEEGEIQKTGRGTERLVWCLEGEVRVKLGRGVYRLLKGNSLSFKGERALLFLNRGHIPAKVLHVWGILSL
ncbi:MAG: helix-turn-helix transcriptional regulator [Candidatus Omnitrophica bacterium]|nr:helix-turn-helix transcriptional regulator [Candidatus Omnitrophota bacterium]